MFTPYVDALALEVRAAGQGERVATVFFGGGTPSILPADAIAALLRACYDPFDVDVEAEISLEANPGTVDETQLVALRQAGVNRLSFGVQSAHTHELSLLGRLHDFPQAAQSVAMARNAGFNNASLDLIYGLPGQSLANWRATLEAALALAPDHLSCYCLSVEEGTLLADWVTAGHIAEPDADLAAQMFELTAELLGDAGFHHYEISNWAKPGFECRHNLVYWRDGAYLGFGAGAHSHRDGWRWWNIRRPVAYIARVQSGASPVEEREEIDPTRAMGEMMILGLRLSEGVRADAFRERFGQELETVYSRELTELSTSGLLEWNGERVRLTDRGQLLGNQVFLRFLT
jgi:oxygen-independent coproporphyrinogen-3 oxidase